jgi:hypothetical protein
MSYFTISPALEDVRDERRRQDVKWGPQNHLDGTGGHGRVRDAERARLECQRQFAEGTGTWLGILEEEVAEAFAESDPVKLRVELAQVAAVAVAWMEAIDRRLAALADGDEPAWPTGSRRVAETTDLAAIREAAMAATFNPAYRVSRCGQQSAHGPHVVRSGPDQPRNCPGGPAWSWSFVPVSAECAAEPATASKEG